MRTATAAVALLLAGCAVPPPPGDWQPLWTATDLPTPIVFGGDGEVRVEPERLALGQGSPLTGVTFGVALPPCDYELEWTVERTLGGDFCCGLTFPVPDGHLSLVLGGWGGAVCGLSCLDGADAAHNETRTLRSFPIGRRNRVHLAVRAAAIAVEVDGAPLLRVDPRGRRCSVRAELDLCRPLGVANFATAAEFAAMRWRRLPPPHTHAGATAR